MSALPASPRRFLVTTPGLSATRWLSFALASHPEVFVAHGKHPLDSIRHGSFRREKVRDDQESITQGNLAADFYRLNSLGGIFATYRALMPEARAVGNVHSFTVDALMQKVGGSADLDGVRVVNLLRHPLRYLASHMALVRSAESYPLYRHYADEMFPQALREFPELLLLECEDYAAFVACAVSCLSVRNLAEDFAFPKLKSVRMEAITTDLAALRDLCENLTGLDYAPERLADFIQQGAINPHRRGPSPGEAQDLWFHWPVWQRDMACMMIPVAVLDHLEGQGYDVSMLRPGFAEAPEARSTAAKESPPLLADQLRRIDPEHPLLYAAEGASPLPSVSSPPRLVEEGFEGFNIVAYADRYYALARSLGPFDLATVSEEALAACQEAGDCFVANRLSEVKARVRGRGGAGNPRGIAAVRAGSVRAEAGGLEDVARQAVAGTRDPAEAQRLRGLYAELQSDPTILP